MASGAYGAIWRVDISGMQVVPGLEEMETPFKTNHKVDTTHHGSTNGWQEWLHTGFKEQPTIKMKVQWDKTNTVHQQLNTWDIAADPPLIDMEFESADGEVIAVGCYIESIQRMNPLKGIISAEIELQPSGAPTITMT